MPEIVYLIEEINKKSWVSSISLSGNARVKSLNQFDFVWRY